MKQAITVMSVLAVLTACGVDGEPIQPTATAGVSISPNGVNTSVGVGARKGPLSLWLGL